MRSNHSSESASNVPRRAGAECIGHRRAVASPDRRSVRSVCTERRRRTSGRAMSVSRRRSTSRHRRRSTTPWSNARRERVPVDEALGVRTRRLKKAPDHNSRPHRRHRRPDRPSTQRPPRRDRVDVMTSDDPWGCPAGLVPGSADPRPTRGASDAQGAPLTRRRTGRRSPESTRPRPGRCAGPCRQRVPSSVLERPCRRRRTSHGRSCRSAREVPPAPVQRPPMPLSGDCEIGLDDRSVRRRARSRSWFVPAFLTGQIQSPTCHVDPGRSRLRIVWRLTDVSPWGMVVRRFCDVRHSAVPAIRATWPDCVRTPETPSSSHFVASPSDPSNSERRSAAAEAVGSARATADAGAPVRGPPRRSSRWTTSTPCPRRRDSRHTIEWGWSLRLAIQHAGRVEIPGQLAGREVDGVVVRCADHRCAVGNS